MRYLLDTCAISDFVKGEPGTLSRLKQTSPKEIAISTISIMEIQYGLSINPQRAKKIQPVIQDLLASITALHFSEDDAFRAADIRNFLKQRGQPIGSYDALIAGTALNNGLTLVTANTSEFKRVPELAIENWRLNSQPI